MSDSRPPIFDDGGGLPDVDRSRRRTESTNGRPAPVGEDGADDWDDDEWRSPNYLVRRAIVVGLILLLIAAIAIFVGRLFGGDGDGSGSGLANADWNHIVTVDDTSGSVVITDTDGEETNRFTLGLRSLTDTEILDRTLVGVDADSVGVVRLDADAEITTTDITTVDITSTGTLLRPSGTTQTVIAVEPTSERMVMVNGPDTEILDTADTDIVPGARYDVALALTEPAGRHVLVTDIGNFQTVLFSFDRDTPSFFSGLALAVDDEFVVTAANVGTNANVAVFDHAGEPGVAAQTPSVRAAMIADGIVILIGVDGEILGLSLTDGEVRELGTLSVGTVESGHVSVSGDRLIVTGSQGTAIVDTEGVAIAELPGARPTVTGFDETAPSATACLVVEREAAGEVSVVDLETGAIGAEAIANPDVLSPVDGCRPIVPTTSGYIGIDLEAVTPVTLVGDVVALSPDGDTIAVERSNRLELVARTSDLTEDDDSDDDEPVDVGRSGRTLYFAEL